MPRFLALITVAALMLSLHSALSADQPAKSDEAGTPLFNGKDLAGWAVKPKKGEPEPLDGKTDAANGRFKVADGILVIDPKVKGDVTLETVKPLAGDVHIRFECLPGAKCNNDLFFRGTKFDIKKADIKILKEDEWNTFEIVAAGEKIEYRCNGESLKTFTAKGPPPPLGLRAEAGPIQFRKIGVVGGK